MAINGNWREPWKCLVVHDGLFDNRTMAYSTEELWFSEWENGGLPWEHPELFERFNPADYVGNWSVPTLVIHGAQDFRIPLEQLRLLGLLRKIDTLNSRRLEGARGGCRRADRARS